MKTRSHIGAWVAILAVLAGCTSTKVTERQMLDPQARIPRPARILVYDFAATPADIPAWSAAAGQYAVPCTPPAAEEIETGRKLGELVAQELVAEIQGMGLSAVRAAGQPAPRVGDAMLVGYFEAIDTGSTTRRLVLGFGSGAADLGTAVEGYVMTDQGPRLLGSGKLGSKGGKTPGLLVPLAVIAATANPIGLIVVGAAKLQGEVTGRTKIEGAAKRTAKLIADELRKGFQRRGWID
ncbi:hypothetical protein MELA_00941 [Candidatus Methylomirabilis lanthanidiphila]|uniref:DUF4410 domain-containing protein n=1 Tax=Candidatus Methylomirabilis lanthanidiphila TaxID=2211376 RepID=A0A564ZJ52_9BACT|nr:DUF4410 domain-containing protein [Candidatus Methylomirabilis lanthanidiphila]VUZ84568.1 hypothetical protein MELA_00941 [Candidatus Methylomirabilis lanthanidiphila]